MKNKIVSILTAFIMCATIFAVPGTAVTYAEDSAQKAEVNLTEPQTEGGEQDTDVEQPEAKNLADAVVRLSKTSYTYSGKAFRPAVTVIYDGVTLISGTDYTVQYKNNVKAGKMTVVVTGTGAYTGSKSAYATINKATLKAVNVTTKYKNYGYTKSPVKCVKVTYNGITLKENTDYKITYKNNTYPGKATYTVTGTGNYKGTVSGYFYISRIEKLSVKSTGTEKITLTWSKKQNVTGYKLYKYNFSKDKWVLWKTIKGSDNNTFTVKNLSPGYGYKFKICTYVYKNGKTHKGEFSKHLYAVTKPAKVKIEELSARSDMTVKVTWDKVKSTGYQVKISRSSDFDGYDIYNVKSSASSKRIKVSKVNKYYYVKVRAYRTYNGKTHYGAWSSAAKVKSKNTGWMSIDGEKFYYKNGSKLHGDQTISGNPYYFHSKTGECLGASLEMWNQVKDASSNTKYAITVDRRLNRLCVYKGEKGSWNMYKYWKCSTGKEETLTPRCNTLIPSSETKLGYIGGHISYTCWYATRFYERCFFHSVTYYPGSKTRELDGRLGYNISDGCVRLQIDNAKWVYDNIKAGTRVIVYGLPD